MILAIFKIICLIDWWLESTMLICGANCFFKRISLFHWHARNLWAIWWCFFRDCHCRYNRIFAAPWPPPQPFRLYPSFISRCCNYAMCSPLSYYISEKFFILIKSPVNWIDCIIIKNSFQLNFVSMISCSYYDVEWVNSLALINFIKLCSNMLHRKTVL